VIQVLHLSDGRSGITRREKCESTTTRLIAEQDRRLPFNSYYSMHINDITSMSDSEYLVLPNPFLAAYGESFPALNLTGHDALEGSHVLRVSKTLQNPGGSCAFKVV
jgi:hypothetical protein